MQCPGRQAGQQTQARGEHQNGPRFCVIGGCEPSISSVRTWGDHSTAIGLLLSGVRAGVALEWQKIE